MAFRAQILPQAWSQTIDFWYVLAKLEGYDRHTFKDGRDVWLYPLPFLLYDTKGGKIQLPQTDQPKVISASYSGRFL